MTYLEEFAKRTIAICKEAIPKVDAVDHFFYKGSAYPYFTLRLGQEDETPNSDDMQRRSHVLILRYVIGHLGAKYEGEDERRIYRDVPTIEDHFASCGWMQSAKFPAPQDFLTELGISTMRGLSIFPAVGTEASQVGVEMNLRAVFMIDVETRY